MGSVTMRRASAAEAAADRLRNDRRDVEGRVDSLSSCLSLFLPWYSGAMAHLVSAILPQTAAQYGMKYDLARQNGRQMKAQQRHVLC